MAKSSEVVRALDLHSDELSRKKNVVGLGQVPAADGRRGDYELAVYVEKILPESALDADDVVPPCVEVPCRDGTVKVPIQVIEQGPVSFERETPRRDIAGKEPGPDSGREPLGKEPA